MKIVMETPRLILREFVPVDADALARVLSDPETMRFYPAPFNRQGVEDWIARNIRRYERDGFGLWALDLKSTGEMIGDCGITLQEVDGEALPESGYHLRRDRRGQGFATEAARACRDYGFDSLKAEFLISLIRPENLPSRRVAERNGMKIWKQTTRVGLIHDVYRVRRKSWDDPHGYKTYPSEPDAHPNCHSERSEESALPRLLPKQIPRRCAPRNDNS